MRYFPETRTHKVARAGYMGSVYGQAVRALVELDDYESATNNALGQFGSQSTHYVRGSSLSIEACRELAKKFLPAHRFKLESGKSDPVIAAWISGLSLTLPVRLEDREMSGFDRDFIAKNNVFAADADAMLERQGGSNTVWSKLYASLSDHLDEGGQLSGTLEEDLLEDVRGYSLYASMRPTSGPEVHEEEICEPQPLTLNL